MRDQKKMQKHAINRGPAPIGSVRFNPQANTWVRKIGPAVSDKELITSASPG